MRVVQPKGTRGSLKWIQRAVNERWSSLDDVLRARLGCDAIEWLSPLEGDDFSEYRDGAFIRLIGYQSLLSALTDFWPRGGPQWDALGRTSRGDVLLVEAKAHVAEMCSPGTSASTESRGRIEKALDELANHLGAGEGRAPWAVHFYQLANRLAHLHFLRRNDVPAWLILVGFLGDRDMKGPSSSEAWEAAYEVAFHVMGLPRKHALSPYIVHVHPAVLDVAPITGSGS